MNLQTCWRVRVIYRTSEQRFVLIQHWHVSIAAFLLEFLSEPRVHGLMIGQIR